MTRFFKNKTGAAAIEFAVIAPILFLFIFGIIETSFVMLLQSIMEQAVRESARSGLTGYTPSGTTRDDYIKKSVTDNLVFLNPSNLTFKTLIYPSYQAIKQAEPYTDSNNNGVYNIGEPYTDVNGNNQWDADMGKSGSGSAGDIVVYRVSYNWTLLTPFIGKFFSSTGQLPITASMVVRNEPY